MVSEHGPHPFSKAFLILSILTIAWSMCAAASFMLGLLHLLLWYQSQRASVYLLSMLMAFSAGIGAMLELSLMHAQSIDAYRVLMQWSNLVVISFAFLAIVLGLSYELVSEAVLASRYACEIKANEARWRSLLTDVQLAVIGLDPQGRVNYANPFLERLISQSADVLIGKPMTALVPERDRAELAEWLAAVSRTGPRPHSRWDLVCPSGALRSLAWSTVRLNERDGGYSGLLSIGEDITKRLDAERSLACAHREMGRLGRANVLGELVSGLAHELNQPLAAILSNAQAARRFLTLGNPEPTELREILDDIVCDDKRAADVIQRLRRMLLCTAPDRQCFSIQEPVSEVLRLMRTELDAQGISVTQEVYADLPPVQADRIEVQQVIMNLLVNAVHALSQSAPERREIRIAAEPQGADSVLVCIEDKGPGIALDELSRVFEPFFTTKSGGLGMGLAICRRIVEAHGGRIRGKNVAGGSRFCFTLPLAGLEQIADSGKRN